MRLFGEASFGFAERLAAGPEEATRPANLQLLSEMGSEEGARALLDAAARRGSEAAADAYLAPFALTQATLERVQRVWKTMAAARRPEQDRGGFRSYDLTNMPGVDWREVAQTTATFKEGKTGPGFTLPPGFVPPPGISPETAVMVVGSMGLRGPRIPLETLHLSSNPDRVRAVLVSYLRRTVEDTQATPEQRAFAWGRLMRLAGPLWSAVQGATAADRAAGN
jgi:hypothetical protein